MSPLTAMMIRAFLPIEEILKDCINQKKSVYDLGYLPDPVTRLEVMY